MQNYQQAFIKTLTESDVNLNVSNQHELHGVSQLQSLFCPIAHGDTTKHRYPATIRFGHLGQKQNINITWYNARASSATRHEYRLYYDGSIMNQISAGDDIMIGITILGEIEIIIFANQQSNYNSWTKCI